MLQNRRFAVIEEDLRRLHGLSPARVVSIDTQITRGKIDPLQLFLWKRRELLGGIGPQWSGGVHFSVVAVREHHDIAGSREARRQILFFKGERRDLNVTWTQLKRERRRQFPHHPFAHGASVIQNGHFSRPITPKRIRHEHDERVYKRGAAQHADKTVDRDAEVMRPRKMAIEFGPAPRGGTHGAHNNPRDARDRNEHHEPGIYPGIQGTDHGRTAKNDEELLCQKED